jgi:hypothetical protein
VQLPDCPVTAKASGLNPPRLLTGSPNLLGGKAADLSRPFYPCLDVNPPASDALGFFRHTPQRLKELLSIGIVPENLPTLDSSADDGLQRTRCIDSRSS